MLNFILPKFDRLSILLISSLDPKISDKKMLFEEIESKYPKI